jgi:hypothetical protein
VLTVGLKTPHTIAGRLKELSDPMRNLSVVIFALVASFAAATVAKAAVLMTPSDPGINTGVGQNFGSQGVGNAASSFAIGDWTFATVAGSVQILNTSDSNGAQPYGTTGNYLSVLGGATENVTFASPLQQFGFYWGSIDTFNKITIDLVGGGTTSFSGSDLLTVLNKGTNPTGCQDSFACNRYVTFSDDTSADIVGFSLQSDQNSFEITNISAVPEPATWAMMILGFLGVGLVACRRRGTRTFRFA